MGTMYDLKDPRNISAFVDIVGFCYLSRKKIIGKMLDLFGNVLGHFYIKFVEIKA